MEMKKPCITGLFVFMRSSGSSEVMTENPRVGSSILSLGTNKINNLGGFQKSPFLL